MMNLKALIEQAGFEVSSENEEEVVVKAKTEEEILKEQAMDGEILSRDELIKLGFEGDGNPICPSCSKNGVEFAYYGGNLVEIQIDEENIQALFEIPECRAIDDDLCYRITTEALIYSYKKAGII